MSLDLKRILDLFDVVQKAAGHPNLASLGAVALKELHGHAATAKKEHEEQLVKEAAEVAEVKAAELKKAEEANRPTVRPAAQAEPEADEFEPDEPQTANADGPIRRREVPEEVNHGS